MVEVIRRVFMDPIDETALANVVESTTTPGKYGIIVLGADGGPIPVSIINSLVTSAYDYISAAYPTTSSEVYTFKTGGAGGTTVATITVTYSDSTKEVLSSVVKS